MVASKDRIAVRCAYDRHSRNIAQTLQEEVGFILFKFSWPHLPFALRFRR